MTERLVLASGSRFRKAMLEAAGGDVDVIPPANNERAVEKTLEGTGASPEEVAQVLAEAKALDVSEKNPGRLVLGCDQTRFTGGRWWHGLFLPFGMAVFAFILLRSQWVTHWTGGITWRGTHYPLRALKGNRL